jgi:uncharacterized protein YbdZ (MbtH family)
MDTVEPSSKKSEVGYLSFNPDLRTIPTGWDLSGLSTPENNNGHKNGKLMEPDPYRFQDFEVHPSAEPQTMPGGWDLSSVLKSKQHPDGHK